jgi:hypothetical protein
MNTDCLLPLNQRWPDDRVTVTHLDSVYIFSQLYRSSAQPNVFQKYLRINSEDSQKIKDFASANQMTYSPYGIDLLAGGGKNVPGWLGPRTNTDKPIFTHRTSGKFHGYPIAVQLAYTLATMQKAGSDVSLDKKSIIEITLPKLFPQIVLDSNVNESAAVRTFPTSFKPDQRHSLEGNFSKYFDLYAPNGLQANTLTVLSPNFMQTLIDKSQQFDVEFYGNKLFFITNDCFYDPTAQKTILRAISQQLEYIDRLLPSWDYQAQDQPFDKLISTYWQGPSTKVGTWHLTSGQTIIAVLAIIALLGLMGAILDRSQ